MQKIYYNNISFLKIIFTLQILYGHIMQHYIMSQFVEFSFYKKLFKYTSYNYGILCEMFFIISGYFLFKELEKYNFKELIIKKIIRLWPVLFFSVLFAYILSRFSIAPWYHLNVIPELLFLNNSMISRIPSVTGVAWYINSMFYSIILYYIIYKLSDKNKFIYINSLIVFIAYSILFNKNYLYNEPIVYYDLFTFMLIRAIAGVGFGMLLYQANINIKINNKLQYFIFGILELILIVTIIIYTSILTTKFAFPILLILFVVLFLLFINKVGFFSNLINKKCFSFMDKYTYPTYIMQWFIFYIFNKFVWHNDKIGATRYPILNIVFPILACCILGIITYYIVENIVKIIKDQTRPDQTRPDQTRPDQTRPTIILYGYN